MAHKSQKRKTDVAKKIEATLTVLQALGLPREQQNDRSALTLLALLGLKPTTPWSKASNPLMGITPMMEFFASHYGKKYAPNTRETVRRFTVHQLEQAGLVVKNPDNPSRPVNSPDNVYQIEAAALELLRSFGSPQWEDCLHDYSKMRTKLCKQNAVERDMHLIPVILPNGRKIELSLGGQNLLIKEIITSFCPRYTPGGEVIYIGDAGDKFLVWEKQRLSDVGVIVDEHGKMPDLVIYHKVKDWLILIEAVTTHGPVNAKRHRELTEWFKTSKVGLVFVTAFMDCRSMARYLGDIAWETEVWVAETPSHLIHFNGERFLGPYNPALS